MIIDPFLRREIVAYVAAGCTLLQPDTHWIVPICEGGPPALNQPPLHCCTQLELYCVYQCCPIAWPSFQYGSFQSVRTLALVHTAWTPLQWFINVAPAPYTYSLPKLSICANLSCESIHICQSNTHGFKLWRCFQLFSVQAKKCEYRLKNRLERKFLAARASSNLSFLVHWQFF